jgi:DNA-binding transcriptional ArsR family regulator
MLSLLTGASLSAAEVARELDITQANASYHLRVLLGAGLLVTAGEEKVNGGVAKKYRHPWDQVPHDQTPITEADKVAQVRVMAEAIPRRFARRVRDERPFFTDADMWVEPQVWEQVLILVRQASNLMHANAKPPRSEGTVRANLSASAFRLADPR